MSPHPTHRNRLSPQPAGGRSIVVGLGRTGLSCARYLEARGLNFAVTDSRPTPPEAAALDRLAPGAQVSFGAFDESLLDGATQIIVSPGVSMREPFLMSAAVRGIPIIGDIELFVREARAPIAAITGTNGKSTVTTLVGLMANAAGRPRLPPAIARRPAAFAIKPTSVVTVLLPFVPVIAAVGACASRANSSMSPMMGMPRTAALIKNGSRSETPGDTMTCAAPSSSDSSNAPKLTCAPGASRSSAGASGGVGLLSVTAKFKPRACRYRAHDNPVRPRPTTIERPLAGCGDGRLR